MITPQERRIITSIRSCETYEQTQKARNLVNNYLTIIYPNNGKQVDEKIRHMGISMLLHYELIEKEVKFLELAGNTESL